jgi:uncharacterized phiE125 gp8 family phage protein
VLIAGYVEAARTMAEVFTGRAFVTQTWELVIDKFPTMEIRLPLPPLQSVASIKYDDGGGSEQTLPQSGYEVDNISQPGWVVPATSGWPTNLWQGINAVRIQFVAGYPPGTGSPVDLAANIPRSIKQGMLLSIGSFYEHREDQIVGLTTMRLPLGAEHLLRQFRVEMALA